jgi:hypothetical protein
MSFYIIMGLWSLSMILLIAFAFWWGNRLEVASRKSKESAARDYAQRSCQRCCQSCGKYQFHPDNSVR